ncbi:hypothetical protein DID88_009197 [Monilinia fructigena]|uniref:Major facilitator superfamily (MFS) profile domain-containing protein n=1 Tax=Monilinia fructigena TaxID=38457 RepID=A0A395IFT9_9HELO|nr:hypothetical protein DID88_009197 [Monilinia fructigena]
MTLQPPLNSGAESASKLYITSTEATLHYHSDSTVLNSSVKEKQTSEQLVIESDLSNHDLTRSDWLPSLQNPINWSPMRKWTKYSFSSSQTSLRKIHRLKSPRASVELIGPRATCTSAFEPAIPAIMVDFHSANDSVASLTVSIYTIGYFLGPFVVALMSELYGHATVLYPGYIGFMLALAVCGSSRSLLLSVIFGAITFVLMGPAIVADLIRKEGRGLGSEYYDRRPRIRSRSDNWLVFLFVIAFKEANSSSPGPI